jgi:DNA-binding response OmpR family regulator
MNTTPTLHACVVADDEPGMRTFVARVLSRERFHVFTASDGHEAVALITAHPCDLLVTDLSMPEGEGIETILTVRKHYPAVKILVISGAFGETMLRTAERLGADASLAKPFTAETLMAAVRALIAAPKE